MIYTFTRENLATYEHFAEGVFKTNRDKYARRNQRNPEAIKFQIITGKLAEIAVSELIPNCSKPDFRIYDTKNKSFDADLTDEWYNYHVKSIETESATRFGIS